MLTYCNFHWGASPTSMLTLHKMLSAIPFSAALLLMAILMFVFLSLIALLLPRDTLDTTPY